MKPRHTSNTYAIRSAQFIKAEWEKKSPEPEYYIACINTARAMWIRIGTGKWIKQLK